MTMPPKPSSIRAYLEHVKSGKARNQMGEIMLCYMNSAVPLTRRMVEEITGFYISSITPRVNLLLYPDPDDHEVLGPLQIADHGTCPVTDAKRVEFLEPRWVKLEDEKLEQGRFEL